MRHGARNCGAMKNSSGSIKYQIICKLLWQACICILELCHLSLRTRFWWRLYLFSSTAFIAMLTLQRFSEPGLTSSQTPIFCCRYCSSVCQLHDWPIHKLHCDVIQSERSSQYQGQSVIQSSDCSYKLRNLTPAGQPDAVLLYEAERWFDWVIASLYNLSPTDVVYEKAEHISHDSLSCNIFLRSCILPRSFYVQILNK